MAKTKDNPKGGKYWITLVIAIIIIALLIWVYGCTPVKYYPQRKYYTKLNHFPNLTARPVLHKAIENFDKEYGSQLDVKAIDFLGVATNLDSLREVMFDNFSIIDEVEPNIYRIRNFQNFIDSIKNVSIFNKYSLRPNLTSNLFKGDLIVRVTITDRANEKSYTSINSIDSSGTRVSGVLFLTTVRKVDSHEFSLEPNSMCKTLTVANYLFTDKPKIAIRVCAHASCTSDSSITNCRSDGMPFIYGPGGSAKVITTNETDFHKPGHCFVTAKYKWATGFKEVEIENEKLGKFKVSGILGREVEGAFTVDDACNLYHYPR